MESVRNLIEKLRIHRGQVGNVPLPRRPVSKVVVHQDTIRTHKLFETLRLAVCGFEEWHSERTPKILHYLIVTYHLPWRLLPLDMKE